MESLAQAVTIILGSILGVGILAVVSSWFRSSSAKKLTYVFAFLAIAAGLWIGWVLIEGNGIPIALVPISLGLFGIWNTRRRTKKKF
jgi:uncharacterized membrane protein YedE/YeeE